jgi:hypothetical protein
MAADAYSSHKEVRSEVGLIGCILTLGKIPAGIDLKPAEFYRQGHAKIWQVMQNMTSQGVWIDYASLINTLKGAGVNLRPEFLIECIERSIILDGELLSLQDLAAKWQISVRNAAYERRKALMKERIVKLIVQNDFQTAARGLQVLIGGGYD